MVSISASLNINITRIRNALILISHLDIIMLCQRFGRQLYPVYANHLRYLRAHHMVSNTHLILVNEVVDGLTGFYSLYNEIEDFRVTFFNFYGFTRQHLNSLVSIPYHIFLDLSDLTNPIRISHRYSINEIILPNLNSNTTLN